MRRKERGTSPSVDVHNPPGRPGGAVPHRDEEELPACTAAPVANEAPIIINTANQPALINGGGIFLGQLLTR